MFTRNQTLQEKLLITQAMVDKFPDGRYQQLFPMPTEVPVSEHAVPTAFESGVDRYSNEPMLYGVDMVEVNGKRYAVFPKDPPKANWYEFLRALRDLEPELYTKLLAFLVEIHATKSLRDFKSPDGTYAMELSDRQKTILKHISAE